MKKIIMMFSLIIVISLANANKSNASINLNDQENYLLVCNLQPIEMEHFNTMAPKWDWRRGIRKILQHVEDTADNLGDLWDIWFPSIIASGNNGFGVNFNLSINKESIAEMEKLNISFKGNVLTFNETTELIANEENTISVKKGAYRVSTEMQVKLLLITN
jgi:hypothetical protein